MKDFGSDYAFDVADFALGGRAVRPTFYEAKGKRVFDLVMALAMLPVVLPLIALCWLLVRLDGGPGFYAQPRVGRDGKVFRCWKLRTMVVDAEAALKRLCERNPAIAREWRVKQKLARDPRITRIGRFLRATSLDELPQFFNVLMGDMSFVGPRPFMTDQTRIYLEAGGLSYFRMRPGITGHWQVYGRGVTSFAGRVDYDDSYYRAISPVEDLRLMIKTAGVVFKRTGT